MSQKVECTKCQLGFTTPKSHNCAPGWGNPNARLIILLDCPGETLAEKLLVWIMYRLSLTAQDVYVDYVFKCMLPHGKPKKASLLLPHKICWTAYPRKQVMSEKNVVVIAGNWGCKLIVGKEMKVMHGKRDPETEAWVIYSFKAQLFNPAECVDSWRVIFKAAEEVGLHPKMNLNVEPFHFPSKKLAGG